MSAGHARTIVAFDYGLRRIGIAVGNTLTSTAAPLETLGVPVAVLGLLGFLAILAVLVLEDQVPLLAAYGRTLVVGMALFGVIFQTYLTYIEASVLNKWCQWCVTSYVIITAVFVIGVVRLMRFLNPLRR